MKTLRIKLANVVNVNEWESCRIDYRLALTFWIIFTFAMLYYWYGFESFILLQAKGDLNTVDFVLISRPLQSNSNAGFVGPPLVMSHYACHCSTASTGPISWLLDGPRALHHNFSTSFCEINLKMNLHNSSDATAFVRITTSDSAVNGGHLNSVNMALSESPSDDQGGWRHVTPVNDVKVTSNISGTQPEKPLSLGIVSPYIWSGSTSTSIHLESMSSAEIPLQICVFSPGIYDLSNYVLHWNLLLAEGQGDQDETRRQSGKCLGHPYYLTVLQST